MNLPQNSARISAMRTQGKDRRKELLAAGVTLLSHMRRCDKQV